MPLVTARQRQVANSVALGHGDALTAAQLGITVNTVRNHVVALMNATGSETRARMQAWLWNHPQFLDEVRS